MRVTLSKVALDQLSRFDAIRNVWFAGMLFALGVAQMCLAQQASPSSKIGDIVTNPLTGAQERVVQLLPDPNGEVASVLTNAGNTFLTLTTVGQTFESSSGTTYTVVSTHVNATTMLVDQVNLTSNPATNPTGTPSEVVTNYSSQLQQAAQQNAGHPGQGPIIPPTTTSGVINEIHGGQSGSSGSNGYCLFSLFGYCMGFPGSDGKAGSPGPPVTRTVPVSYGPIASTASNTPGITVGTNGGNGGDGGSLYGGGGGYNGGAAGQGGQLTLSNATSVSTSGDKSYGVFGISSSGKGGKGGSGYLFAGGGSGGTPAQAGPVSISNTGQIDTFGAGSHGIYALSAGGSAGDGGGSWGIAGNAGSGGNGGNGGNVSVTNDGTIITSEDGSHGILAQSIGGTGGNGGDAGGIFALGGDASSGGTSGNVQITNQANAYIETRGPNSIGVFGQSIAGGGGDSGVAVGIAALGGNGGSGNNAGAVTITNAPGSKIFTTNDNSHGVFGQSIGGGGGNTAPTIGVVSVGGTASVGGNGSTVTIDNGAIIGTMGTN